MTTRPKSTKVFTRRHAFVNVERAVLHIRIPAKTHKRLVREALDNEMTLNDWINAIIDAHMQGSK